MRNKKSEDDRLSSCPASKFFITNERKTFNPEERMFSLFPYTVAFWIHIGAPKFILSVIANGYCLPFQCTLVCISLNINKSALKFKDFVEKAIEELLLSNRVLEKLNPPYVVNPLSVSVQANGKKRLILDLRHVNKYLIKRQVKYEDWTVALAFFQKDYYMISFDLKSGYHHVEIHEDHQCFLG